MQHNSRAPRRNRSTKIMGISEYVAKPSKSTHLGPPASRGLSLGRLASPAGFTAAMMMAADVAAVLFALCLASIFRLDTLTGITAFGTYPAWFGAMLLLRPAYLLFFIGSLLWMNHRDGLYGSLQAGSIWHEMRWTIQACFTAGLALCGSMFLMHDATAPRVLVFYLLGLTTLFLCMLRCWWRCYLPCRRFKHSQDTSNVRVAGAGHVASERRNEQRMARRLKRGCDIAISFLLLLLLLPTLLVIALCIKVSSPGPILSGSERIGKKGRVFSRFKFRTMTAAGPALKLPRNDRPERNCIPFGIKDAPRVTAVGRILRKYSLDALPQLLNVLRGDMSLVGPRPSAASEVARYDLQHLQRFEVPPGLTGLWQIRAREDVSSERQMGFDLAYVENWSFWLDLKILGKTAAVVLRGAGSE